MNWKPWGKDNAQISTDGVYSIHHTARGWDVWRRLPYHKRIARDLCGEQQAKALCESDTKTREHA